MYFSDTRNWRVYRNELSAIFANNSQILANNFHQSGYDEYRNWASSLQYNDFFLLRYNPQNGPLAGSQLVLNMPSGWASSDDEGRVVNDMMMAMEYRTKFGADHISNKVDADNDAHTVNQNK